MKSHVIMMTHVCGVFQGACVKRLSSKAKLEDNKATKQMVALLSAPLEKYNDVVTALTLSNYPRLLDFLDAENNKIMAMVIVQSIMKNMTCIATADKVLLISYLILIQLLIYKFQLFSLLCLGGRLRHCSS